MSLRLPESLLLLSLGALFSHTLPAIAAEPEPATGSESTAAEPTAAESAAAKPPPRWTTLEQTIVLQPEQRQNAATGSVGNSVELQISSSGPSADEAMEIGIAVLDPGLAADSASNRKLGIFPEIREAEARYLPYALRRTLVDSNQWGAVRVLPELDPGYEVLLTGRILESNGATLSLQIQARDSRDRLWFDRVYTVVAEETAYLKTERRLRRPFQDLYNQLANDLLNYRQQLDDSELRNIHRIAAVRHAASLAPEAFAEYLELNQDGLFQLRRLPAREDPMMARIGRIREQEYLFIDTTDEQYAELYTEMTPVYDLWRQFLREQLSFREAWEARLATRDKPRSGSYQALKQVYNNFKWEKIQRQELQVLAEGFDNEIAPTSLVLEGSVVNLNGSLDERYREWRRILQQIYSLETGA
ncbi:MAG: hypothetical protein ABJ308_06725 [Halieaceae bacterium]